MIEVICEYCGKKFLKELKYIKRTKHNFCSNECCCKFLTMNNRITLKCSYCGKEFIRGKSKLKNSKSKLYFCCKKCKDLAQRCDSKILNKNLVRKDYRTTAYLNKEHKCERCGLTDKRCLCVHHINGKHNDNRLENLMILCENCHKIIHYENKMAG